MKRGKITDKKLVEKVAKAIVRAYAKKYPEKFSVESNHMINARVYAVAAIAAIRRARKGGSR